MGGAITIVSESPILTDGASIVFVSNSDDKKCWEIAIQKDGELWTDDDGLDYIWSDLTEEGVVETCDHIYFM